MWKCNKPDQTVRDLALNGIHNKLPLLQSSDTQKEAGTSLKTCPVYPVHRLFGQATKLFAILFFCSATNRHHVAESCGRTA